MFFVPPAKNVISPMGFHVSRESENHIVFYRKPNSILILLGTVLQKTTPEVAINDRFHEVSPSTFLFASKLCFTTGFVVYWSSWSLFDPIMVLADGDWASLHRQSQLLRAALQARGARVELRVIDGEDHYTIVPTLSRGDRPAGRALLSFVARTRCGSRPAG